MHSLEQLRFNKKKLESLRNLAHNWNGNNGMPFDDKLIRVATDIISHLDYQPQIFPTGRGTIQIERYIDEENFAEIEISGPNKNLLNYPC